MINTRKNLCIALMSFVAVCGIYFATEMKFIKVESMQSYVNAEEKAFTGVEVVPDLHYTLSNVYYDLYFNLIGNPGFYEFHMMSFNDTKSNNNMKFLLEESDNYEGAFCVYSDQDGRAYKVVHINNGSACRTPFYEENLDCPTTAFYFDYHYASGAFTITNTDGLKMYCDDEGMPRFDDGPIDEKYLFRLQADEVDWLEIGNVPIADNSYYTIKNANSGLNLGLAEGSDKIFEQNVLEGYPTQKFILRRLYDKINVFSIQSVHLTLPHFRYVYCIADMLSIPNYADSKNKFYIIPQGDGTYKIKSLDYGKYLAIKNNSLFPSNTIFSDASVVSANWELDFYAQSFAGLNVNFGNPKFVSHPLHGKIYRDTTMPYEDSDGFNYLHYYFENPLSTQIVDYGIKRQMIPGQELIVTNTISKIEKRSVTISNATNNAWQNQHKISVNASAEFNIPFVPAKFKIGAGYDYSQGYSGYKTTSVANSYETECTYTVSVQDRFIAPDLSDPNDLIYYWLEERGILRLNMTLVIKDNFVINELFYYSLIDSYTAFSPYKYMSEYGAYTYAGNTTDATLIFV